MPKVILFGGNSDIGIAIAEKFVKSNTSYSSIVSYVRKMYDLSARASIDVLEWKTDSWFDLEKALEGVHFEKDDLVVISIGTLGQNYFISDVKKSINFQEVYGSIESNLTIPLTVLAYSVNALAKSGGGRVFLMSSAAAFPPLEPNSYYSSSKLALDSFAVAISEESRKNKVFISIIRPGFIPTKLNAKRRPTMFSSTAAKLSYKVISSGNKKVIWEPSILRLITFGIRSSKVLRKLATKKFKESHQID